MFARLYIFNIIFAISVAIFTLVVEPKFGLSVAAWRTLGLVIIMVFLWILEVVPLGIVGLLPIVYAPMVGIVNIKEILPYYSSTVVFLTLGGFAIGLALEVSNLHKRIALFALSKVGHNPSRQLLAFMLVTALISMWINNTSTVVMLLPVVISVIAVLNIKEGSNYAKALLIGLAYSASIGGVGTIIGTTTNFIFVGLMDTKANIKIDFVTWMMYGFPLMAVLLTVAYLFICKMFKLDSFKKEVDFDFKQEYKNLGVMDKKQKLVAIVFFCTALAWIFKKFINNYLHIPITDEITAISAFIALFILPVDLKNKQFILNIADIKRLEFNILFLLGGGLALAGLFGKSGLDVWIAGQLGFLNTLPTLALILCLVFIMVFLTELTSNVAITASVLPLFIAFATQYGVNPLFFAAPLTVAASMAFMLPVATPPNAVVFSSGRLTIKDLMRTGLYLNVICAVVISVYSYYVVPYIFNI